jgi:hypothetical protein
MTTTAADPPVKIPDGWTLGDPAPYESPERSRRYRFPFALFDDAPGGSNLGRIEWNLELLRGPRKSGGRYFINGLLLFCVQTRDERYGRRLFYFPTSTEGFTSRFSRRQHGGFNFMECVWRATFCEVHGAPIFSAYPHDGCSALLLDVGSSISCEAWFE